MRVSKAHRRTRRLKSHILSNTTSFKNIYKGCIPKGQGVQIFHVLLCKLEFSAKLASGVTCFYLSYIQLLMDGSTRTRVGLSSQSAAKRHTVTLSATLLAPLRDFNGGIAQARNLWPRSAKVPFIIFRICVSSVPCPPRRVIVYLYLASIHLLLLLLAVSRVEYMSVLLLLLGISVSPHITDWS